MILFRTSYKETLSRFLSVLLIVEYKGLSAAPVTIEFFSMPKLRMWIIRLVDIFSPAPEPACIPSTTVPLSRTIIYSFQAKLMPLSFGLSFDFFFLNRLFFKTLLRSFTY